MESLLREWDGETVIVRYDRPTGAWIFIAIHSTLRHYFRDEFLGRNPHNPKT